METFKVAVTDYTFKDLDIERNVLSKEKDIELIEGHARTQEEVVKLAKKADGIITQYAPINDFVLKQLDKCKIISCYGVGVDTVDLNTANMNNIYVCNVPDYCTEEVSNHALTLLLNCSKKIVALNNQVKNGKWDFKTAVPIRRFSTQIVGILGYGRIPKRLTEKLINLGFTVLVYDPYVPKIDIKKANALPCSLEYIFKNSDFLSVHLPLTDKTSGLINEKLFRLAKSSLIIINTSRGEVINEKDLIIALKLKKIGGAALDVIEKEPIEPDNPLLQMNNVILTPHIAWYSEESQLELRRKCAENILNFFQNKNPKYVVNKKFIDTII